MKKVLCFILLFIILIVPVNSITINDLINSYNYSYNDKNFNLNLININQSLDSIKFNIKINSQKINSQILFGTKNSNLETNKLIYKNLSFGNNYLNLSLNISSLNSLNYQMYFIVYDKNLATIYRNYDLFNFKILNKSINYFLINKTKILNSQYYILKSKNYYNFSYLLNKKQKNYSLKYKINSNKIIIKNISYNKNSGKIFINLKNFGNEILINNKLEIYSQNFSKIYTSNLILIGANQSLNLTLNISKNNSKLLIQIKPISNLNKNINYDFLFWPTNLTEICLDKIDNNKNGLIDENCKIQDLNKIKINNLNNSKFIKINNLNLEKKIVSSKSSSIGGGKVISNIPVNNENNIKNKNYENLILIENISKNLSNQIIKIFNKTKNYNNKSKFKKINEINNSIFFNLTPFNSTNFIINSTNKIGFLENNKITISGFLIGFVSFILYFFLA